MFELKKGMKFKVKNLKDIYTVTSVEGWIICTEHSFFGENDIEWEETAKLNGVDLEYEQNIDTFRNIVGNEVNISISELKQKKEQLRQDVFDLLKKFEIETNVKVKKIGIEDIEIEGYSSDTMKLKELVIELEV